MHPLLFQTRARLKYWLDAVDEHSLHSPFFYDFYTRIVRRRSKPNSPLERMRRALRKDSRIIEFDDLGANRRRKRRVSDIARTSLTPPKYSTLFERMIDGAGAKNILELGTSLGINTLYLAGRSGPGERKVITMEGAPQIAAIASFNFEFAHARNITIAQGDISTTLTSCIQKVRSLDFVYIDANHRYEPTVQYFGTIVSRLKEKSIVVIDDIHRSAEMERAWTEIRKNKLVYGSADLFRCGVLFFDPSLNKQHVILQF